jgi:hypothetical protein
MRIRQSLKTNLQKLISHVVRNQREFDYSYYLNKNAPLPSDWKNRKEEIQELAKRPLLRAAAYRELLEHCYVPNQ